MPAIVPVKRGRGKSIQSDSRARKKKDESGVFVASSFIFSVLPGQKLPTASTWLL
jgi:hypothetical protein